MNKHLLTVTSEQHSGVCLQQSDGSTLLQKLCAGFSVRVFRSPGVDFMKNTYLHISLLLGLFLRIFSLCLTTSCQSVSIKTLLTVVRCCEALKRDVLLQMNSA